VRVGLAIETDSPGGAETMLLELARELQVAGHDVVGFGPTGGEGWLTARLAELGIERELIEFNGPFGLGSVRRIASRLRSREVHVLHSHDFTMAVCGALGARAAGRPHVITMHGGTYYASSSRRRLALRVAMGLSRHTVAVSHAFRETLCGTLGVRSSSIDVIHNGLAERPGSALGLRAELGLEPEDALVLAVGNLLPVKGHAVLLRAFAALQSIEKHSVLAIAGRGPQEKALRDLARDLGLDGRLRLLGYRSDVFDLLSAADVFVMPSLSEGLPMALIEAMLAGRAIIASNVGGIPELLSDPSLGVLVESGNADVLAEELRRVLCDPALRRRLGEAAKTRATEHFTASAMARRYLTLYGSRSEVPEASAVRS